MGHRVNHRDRVLAAIRLQPVDRLPTDMWATPEVHQRLFAHFGVSDIGSLYDRLDIDGIITITPPYIGPEPEHRDGLVFDEWGIGYHLQSYEMGVYREEVVHPLATARTVADLQAYRWPTADWYDYDALVQIASAFPERAVACGYAAFSYYHAKLRGLELSLMDPLLHPELTHCILGHLSDFFCEYHCRCFEAGKGIIDITEVSDDFGAQTGPLMSPKVFERFFRAPMQRAMDLAKSYHIIVFHHDDGDMRRLLPTLVDMGIEVLNPIQWRCGSWDLQSLKATYGDSICFHGAVDNQRTLPFGSPEDVRDEVRHLIQVLAADRTGLVIAPCHNLQPNTPIENIVALDEAAQEYGSFANGLGISSSGTRHSGHQRDHRESSLGNSAVRGKTWYLTMIGWHRWTFRTVLGAGA